MFMGLKMKANDCSCCHGRLLQALTAMLFLKTAQAPMLTRNYSESIVVEKGGTSEWISLL